MCGKGSHPNGGNMLELQEMQHKRIVMLASAALVFAVFATWQLFSGYFNSGTSEFAHSSNLYLLSCIILMVMAIVIMMLRSFQDFRAIRRGALFDKATGLPSRANLEAAITAQFSKLQPGEAAAVILVDIRRFKSLNHSFGYQAGDRIIQAVSARLKSVEQENLTLARMGGDRFALFMHAITSQGAVSELVTGLQRALIPPFSVAEKSIYIDLSIGTAYVAEQDMISCTELLRRAEFALLEAKASDGKQHVNYSEGSAASAKRASTMETGLRQTLEANELEIHYQPLVDANFDKIVAVEALARWTHPQFGRVSPLDFVGMAESLGLVAKMGNNILLRACQQIRPLGNIRLAVNISPRHFLAPGFVVDVKAILAQADFPAHRLELEVTENVLISENETAADVIAAVRALGISVALDDFGTGYSGLSYLSRFQLDRIKIDASFVRELEASISAQSMVATIIHLARDRGLEITVEGVETMGQVLFLSRFGSLWYQGYLFAKPMPFSDLLQTSGFAQAALPRCKPGVESGYLDLKQPQPDWSRQAVA